MRLLDLFCGAGGAAMGYHRAGFDEIVGVDKAPQPRYPFDFVQWDALEYLANHGHEFDAIHASPPCQGYTIMHNLPWLRGRDYPLLLLPVIEMLEELGKPYVVENVMGARHGSKTLKKRGLEAHGLKAGWLCGTMFGLPFYRHRLFAANWLWLAAGHQKHVRWIRPGRMLTESESKIAPILTNRREQQDQRESAGRDRGWLNIREGYERVPFSVPTYKFNESLRNKGYGHSVGWRLAAEAMGIDWMIQSELTQAVPPSYTETIGKQLMTYVQQEKLSC